MVQTPSTPSPLIRSYGTGPMIRFHDLRHSVATMLLASGATLKDVQYFLRHSTSRVTLETYVHSVPDHKETTARRIDSVLAAAEGSDA